MGELETAQQALVTAQTEAATAQAAAAAAQAAHDVLQQQLQNAPQPQAQLAGGGAGAAGNVNLPQIDRPEGTRWSIREAMQLSRAEYAEIQVSHLSPNVVPNNGHLTRVLLHWQRTIRNLVIRAQLDWTEDFRRQDPDKMAILFRAVRTNLGRLHVVRDYRLISMSVGSVGPPSPAALYQQLGCRCYRQTVHVEQA